MNPNRILWCVAAILPGLSGPLPGTSRAIADDYVDRVNKPYTDLSTDRRSDLILLPRVAAMTPAPGAVSDFERAMLLPAGAAGWDDAAAWAQKPEQKAVLEAIRKIGADWDKPPAWGFGQPYGSEGVAIDMVRSRLYTDLGDPPTLAAARFMYLEGLQRVENLVHVEATRLSADGKADEAITLLIDWGFLTRQIVERQFFREFSWGLAATTRAAVRIRDVAYLDWRGKKVLSDPARGAMLSTVIDRLDLEKGEAKASRLRFPIGERVASEQVIERVYPGHGAVSPAAFAATLSALGSSERPLRLFAEAATWQSLATSQKSWREVSEELPKLYEDWVARWDLDPFDRRMETPFYYPTMNAGRSAAISKVIPDMTWLFSARQALRTEIVGTRASLGLLGFWYANKSLAPTISSIRPRWVKQLDADPFNPNRARGQQPPLEYFVPIRDQPKAEGVVSHEVNVFVPGGANFSVKFKDDQFILYSVGRDGAKNWASRVQNTWELAPGADYLIWPPVQALYRQHLVDTGALK